MGDPGSLGEDVGPWPPGIAPSPTGMLSGDGCFFFLSLRPPGVVVGPQLPSPGVRPGGRFTLRKLVGKVGASLILGSPPMRRAAGVGTAPFILLALAQGSGD